MPKKHYSGRISEMQTGEKRIMKTGADMFENIKVVLASQSPRRKELLCMICKDFEVMPADIDETLPEGVSAEEAAEYTAKRKAAATECCDALVIACDTIVVAGDEILGKPADRQDGKRMLELLSGRTHKVISGVAIRYKNKERSFSQTTEVTFYEMSEEDINDYLDSGEPFDKAGAYGIQGLGGVYVEGIRGDFFNVVGLPVARLKRELIAMLEAN